MAKSYQKGNNGNGQELGIEVSDRQIEIFARRLLPEIKRFLADEKVKLEFEEWQRKRDSDKIK